MQRLGYMATQGEYREQRDHYEALTSVGVSCGPRPVFWRNVKGFIKGQIAFVSSETYDESCEMSYADWIKHREKQYLEQFAEMYESAEHV